MDFMAIDDYADVLGLYIDISALGSPPRLFNFCGAQIERQSEDKQNEHK